MKIYQRQLEEMLPETGTSRASRANEGIASEFGKSD